MGKKIVSCGGVFDLAVEQPQLFRKLPKNKNKQNTPPPLHCYHSTVTPPVLHRHSTTTPSSNHCHSTTSTPPPHRHSPTTPPDKRVLSKGRQSVAVLQVIGIFIPSHFTSDNVAGLVKRALLCGVLMGR